MRVKICGITRLADALYAAEQGADALGFIFAKSSTRYIDPDAAGCIIRSLPPFVTPVGVFVDEPRELILRAIAISGIRAVQLQGDESPAETEGYVVPVIKAFHVGPGFDPAILRSYLTAGHLLEAYVPGKHGGTGTTFDWTIAVSAKEYGRIILSGGIRPENVAEAVRTVKPYGIDLCSGVEASPGVKDHEKIRRLFAALDA
jgi:phosphoribosylanthranilate isomerase